MRLKAVIAMAVVCIVGTIQADTTSTWVGGTYTNWADTASWANGIVPNGLGYKALFNLSGSVVIDLGGAVRQLGSTIGYSVQMQGTADYTMNGGTLRIARTAGADFAADFNYLSSGDSVINSDLEFRRAALTGTNMRLAGGTSAGDLTLNGSLTFTNASMQLNHASAASKLYVNGDIIGCTSGKELWVKSYSDEGTVLAGTVSAANSAAVRITIALNNDGCSTLFSNLTGQVADSSLAELEFIGGTVKLGADDQIASGVGLRTAGTAAGTLDLNGYDNLNTGALNLDCTAGVTFTFDFSDAEGESLYFADSSVQTWTSGNVLDLVGFEFGVDELRFGNGANGLTPTQLSMILIDGATVDNLWLDGDGFLTTNAVPPVLATWTGSTNSWASTNAWDTATVPSAVGDGVVFGDSGEYNVEIDSSVVLGRTDEMTFSVEGSGSYTFSGTGSLKIERGTANKFVNGDLYLTTSGDTVFNVPLAVTRTEVSSLASRIRTDSAAGNVTFNQSITWDNTSLQIRNDSASAIMEFNGTMTGGSANHELWVSAPLEGGTISLNNVIFATTNNVRITIAAGDGIVRLANPSGVVVDSSMDFLSFIGGRLELGNNDQVASEFVLYNTGGTLDLNGYSNSNADTLTLASISGDATLVVDFSDAAAESLCFADSSAAAWGASDLLNLSGFVFDTDSIRFGTDENGLTETQLSQIQVDGETIVGLKLDSDGYLALPTVGTVGSQMVSGGNGLALTWENVEGVSYSVETNDDLVFGTWGVLQSNLTSIGSSISYTGTISAAQNFFRIVQE